MRIDALDVEGCYRRNSQGLPEVLDHRGLEQKKIAAGREAIDEELERKVPFVFQGGGSVPMIDMNARLLGEPEK